MEGLEQQLQAQQQGVQAAIATPPAAAQQQPDNAPLAAAPSGPWMQALLSEGDDVADAAELARLASQSPQAPASAGSSLIAFVPDNLWMCIAVQSR